MPQQQLKIWNEIPRKVKIFEKDSILMNFIKVYILKNFLYVPTENKNIFHYTYLPTMLKCEQIFAILCGRLQEKMFFTFSLLL